jgi:hypothetical protein
MKLSKKTFTILVLVLASMANAQDKMLFETNYYRFYSNLPLNEHLWLYKHATEIRNSKLPDDSIAFYLKNARIPGNAKNHAVITDALKFYRDSVAPKDMLFNTSMRKFSVLLTSGKLADAEGWQTDALKHIRNINAFFKKQLWPAIDSSSRAWAQNAKGDLDTHEKNVMARLQKLYNDTMPNDKIRVDLGVYATWAGAYSYSQGIDHILICTFEGANPGRLGVEVVFHEGSHFIIDKVFDFVAEYYKLKNAPGNRRQTWHNLLFYTTGIVTKEAYAAQGISFLPYYKQAKFEENIPPFKLTTTALALYWDPYMRGETTQEEALKKVIDHILANEK